DEVVGEELVDGLGTAPDEDLVDEAADERLVVVEAHIWSPDSDGSSLRRSCDGEVLRGMIGLCRFPSQRSTPTVPPIEELTRIEQVHLDRLEHQGIFTTGLLLEVS